MYTCVKCTVEALALVATGSLLLCVERLKLDQWSRNVGVGADP